MMNEKKMDSEDRLSEIVDFCRLADREKFISRRTYLTDGERLENDAEHAWHLAIMALLLHEYANEDVDLLKVISIVLIHDLVEIYAGDTFAYDQDGLKTQKERENAAADRLFTQLPEDLAAKIRHLWDEFEADETPEAHFAHTLDNFQPMNANYGILRPLAEHIRDKALKKRKLAERSLARIGEVAAGLREQI